MARLIQIFLPAYNEEAGLGDLLDKLADELEGRNYHVLVVDDGSRDRTYEIAKSRVDQMPLEVLRHERNRGLWETIRDGFEWVAERRSPQDVLIRLDADGTHEPKYIDRMLEKIDEGFDVVITSRFQPGGGAQGVNAYRTFISRCANGLMKLAFPIQGVWEYSCGYRAYRVGVVQGALEIFGNDLIDLKGVGFTCTIEKLIKFRMMGARISEVPFVLRYDKKFSDSKMVTSITTLGYLILILKYIYPWGWGGRQIEQRIQDWRDKIDAHRARDEKLVSDAGRPEPVDHSLRR